MGSTRYVKLRLTERQASALLSAAVEGLNDAGARVGEPGEELDDIPAIEAAIDRLQGALQTEDDKP